LEFDIPGEKMGWDVEKTERWIDKHEDKMSADVKVEGMGIDMNDNKPQGGNASRI